MRNIFLIGFMGCGKSTVADKFQELYGMQIREMDQIIAERAGKSIPHIFEECGEEYFRDLESHTLKDICQGTGQVVSCGGGIVLRDENVSSMKSSGVVIWLTAKPETILERVVGDENRPILQGKKTLEDIVELMEQRHDKYEKAADVVILTDDKSIQAICEEIVHNLTQIGE